ncbi:MAG: hypothetical protein HC896_13830 [Bacteroidales bacterium]|nr:hypothetical protein [Bacteroidales bacterium]
MNWFAFNAQRGVIDNPVQVYQSSSGLIWAVGSHDNVPTISYMQQGQWRKKPFANYETLLLVPMKTDTNKYGLWRAK